MDSIRPKKSLGQNFLNDKNVILKIIDYFSAQYKFPLLEIGPGTGALTQHLISESTCFVAVEFDEQAVQYLQKKFPENKYPDFRLIHSDIRKIDLQQVFADCLSNDMKINVIGNIPYNISSDIIFYLIKNRNIINSAQLMLQKEVAERLCAKPDSKTYGITTVAVNLAGECEYLFDVSPKSFFPSPKVTSAVIRINFNRELPEGEFNSIMKIVKAAFNQRRKQLRNSLKAYLNQYTGNKASEFINYFEITKSKFFDKRPENVNLNEFKELYKELQIFVDETQKK